MAGNLRWSRISMSGNGLFLQMLQARRRPPTAWENELGDVLEEAFSAGIVALEPLVARLNASAVATPAGGRWTETIFCDVMRDLAASA